MTLSRRKFLATSSAVSVGITAPGLFGQAALAAKDADKPGGQETILVVVQLSGGNDGLNTVIPFDHEEYQKGRPTLKQSAKKVHKLNDSLGLHPSMSGMAELWEDQQLAIVQGVGYPNPNRSHFASMDIWHRASRDKDQPFGWLGRALPLMKPSQNGVYIGAGETPLALFGTNGYAPTFESLDDYVMKVTVQGDDPKKRKMIQGFADRGSKRSELLDMVRNSARETYASSERMRKVTKNYQTPVEYPATGLATRLKLVAQLIDAGVPDRLYYTQLGGFDTHAVQAASHGGLLEELSGAMTAFRKDLKHHGHDKRVLVVTFSEFGRRIKENGSRGTDHGAASQMFLAGPMVKPGLIGEHPDLTKPLNGDLRFHTDFRSVYATLLSQWLQVDPQTILEQKFPPADVLKTADLQQSKEQLQS